jgi:hypothetical protein
MRQGSFHGNGLGHRREGVNLGRMLKR